MNRLSRVIAPMLRTAGLDVRTVGPAGGEVHELVVTNPARPDWGRIVIDREVLMEWGYWSHLADDTGAADIATIIIAIMATSPGNDSERYGRHSNIRVAEEATDPTRRGRLRVDPQR
jgi:hypothetical protein